MAQHLLDAIPTAPPYHQADYLHRAANLRLCGHSLLFRYYTAAAEIRLAAGRFCQQDKLCPLCALRRGGKYVHAYTDKIGTVRAAEPSLKPFMVTITIANGEDVGERAGHLMSSWCSLLGRRRLALHRGDRCALAPVVGGVASIECIRGKGGGWHPHLHAVVLSADDLGEGRWPELSREWHDITGDSMIVHVQPITDDGDLGGDLCEVFKYALKFADLDLADNLAAFHALKGRHLIRPFGNLRGVPEPDVLTDDLLSGDQPYVDLLYRFWAGRYHLTPDLRSDIVSGHEQETAPTA